MRCRIARNLDFAELGAGIPSTVKTVILFPPTGTRIWKAIETHSQTPKLPAAFFVRSMEQAVRIAYEQTERGKICLLSPASPSFGTFKDYKQRGEKFKSWIQRLSDGV